MKRKGDTDAANDTTRDKAFREILEHANKSRKVSLLPLANAIGTPQVMQQTLEADYKTKYLAVVRELLGLVESGDFDTVKGRSFAMDEDLLNLDFDEEDEDEDEGEKLSAERVPAAHAVPLLLRRMFAAIDHESQETSVTLYSSMQHQFDAPVTFDQNGLKLLMLLHCTDVGENDESMYGEGKRPGGGYKMTVPRDGQLPEVTVDLRWLKDLAASSSLSKAFDDALSSWVTGAAEDTEELTEGVSSLAYFHLSDAFQLREAVIRDLINESVAGGALTGGGNDRGRNNWFMVGGMALTALASITPRL